MLIWLEYWFLPRTFVSWKEERECSPLVPELVLVEEYNCSTPWVKKTRHHSNFAKCLLIFKTFSLADSAVNLQQSRVKTFHHALVMSLHYLVKYLCSKKSPRPRSAAKCHVRQPLKRTVSKYMSGEISSIQFPARKAFTSVMLKIAWPTVHNCCNKEKDDAAKCVHDQKSVSQWWRQSVSQ